MLKLHHTVFLLFLLIFQYCSAGKPEEFIKKNDEFTPKTNLGEPQFYENSDLIMIAKRQNYIKRNDKTFRITVEEQNSSLGWTYKE